MENKSILFTAYLALNAFITWIYILLQGNICTAVKICQPVPGERHANQITVWTKMPSNITDENRNLLDLKDI